VPAQQSQRIKQLRTWHLSALQVVSEPMAALAQTTDRDYYTRAANEDCINGGSWTRTKYGYDNANQLMGLTYKLGSTTVGSLTYGYDNDGRIVTRGGTLDVTNLPAAVTSTAYDANNRLTNWGAKTLSYDADGNLTGDGTNTYNWNTRNQLIGIAGGSSGSFVYDAFGRRESKTIGGTSTNFLYDGFNVEQELNGTTPAANYLTGANIDEVFSRTTSGGTQSYLTDNLGSTLALTSSAGAIQTSYTYEPYGNTTATGTSSTNALQYTGRENDGDTLYYYRARYYSPTLGRFISEDPLELGGGDVNYYNYVFNNPITSFDPYGLTQFQYSAGYHVPSSTPGVAEGPQVSSHISDFTENPIQALTSDPVTDDSEYGAIADIGVSAGLGDFSGTGGECAGKVINIGVGKYGGLQITLRKYWTQTWDPLKWIDGISVGLGLGIASPVTISNGQIAR